MSRHLRPMRYIFSETIWTEHDRYKREEERTFSSNNEAIDKARQELISNAWLKYIYISRESKNSRGERDYKFVAQVTCDKIIKKNKTINY